MRMGYVLDFTNASFEEFFNDYKIDIYNVKYGFKGESKANRLRAFWEIGPHDILADVLSGLLDCWWRVNPQPAFDDMDAVEGCKKIIQNIRLQLHQHPSLKNIMQLAESFNAEYLANQIKRMEQSIESDPSLAIGTAKELVETCCKTILRERGLTIPEKPEIPVLTKATMKALNLIPDDVPDKAKGKDTIKRLLSNLATIIQWLTELRGLYGTGHGKDGKSKSLKPRHARLAMGAATTLAIFMFDTHKEKET